jgi:hypothetical protein
MKLSQLKTNEVRTTMEFFIDNKMETVTIMNPLGERREELLRLVLGDNAEGKAQEDAGKNIYEILFRECTDLEITEEDDIIEILSAPNEITSRIVMELNDIVSELQTEALVTKIMQINAVEKSVLGVALNIKNNKVVNEVEKLMAIENEVLTALDEILNLAQSQRVNVELEEALDNIKSSEIVQEVKKTKQSKKKPN